MNGRLLEYKRKCAGYKSQFLMAQKIGKTMTYYRNREKGFADFSAEDVLNLTEALDLNFTEFNEIFYDGKLKWNVSKVEVA